LSPTPVPTAAPSVLAAAPPAPAPAAPNPAPAAPPAVAAPPAADAAPPTVDAPLTGSAALMARMRKSGVVTGEKRASDPASVAAAKEALAEAAKVNETHFFTLQPLETLTARPLNLKP